MRQKPHNTDRKSPRLEIVVPTGGEILPDGTLLELIHDVAQPGGLALLKFDGTKTVVGSRIVHRGRTYVPLTLHPSVKRALRLPSSVCAFGSTAELFEELVAVTARFTGLDRQFREQGNWWHALVGAPFFLAFPMIWLHLRSLFSKQLSTSAGRRSLWIAAGLSIVGTILAELPFLFHLAGTSEWQRLAVLCVDFGIVIASAVLSFLRRRDTSPTRACVVGLNTAYLANAAVCLVVYSDATGTVTSRSGWLVTMAIVWPMVLQLVWIFGQSCETAN